MREAEGERGLRLIWSIIKQLLNTEVSKRCFMNLKFWNHTTVPPWLPWTGLRQLNPIGFYAHTLHNLHFALFVQGFVRTLPDLHFAQ